MKLLKYLAILTFFGGFFACNNESIDTVEQENNNDNALVMESISEFMRQFDDNGNLDENENPTGNMAIDFCFDFVYPLSFYYNDGSILTVESVEAFIEILINLDEEFYINGVVYPFDVEVFNEASTSFEIITIENDEDFEHLLENCAFDDEEYYCPEIWDPVCIELNTQNGESFIITYPNYCYAFLDGFSEEDFLEECDVYDDEDGHDDECECNEECESCLQEDIVPVCVEITFPNNPSETYIEIFPNACFAICFGFSEEDFIDCD